MTQEPAPSTLRTRSSLLFRLRNWDDDKSWEEFYRLYRRLVYGFARKSGLTHEEAEEVSNDVFTRIAKTIQEFEARPERGSFRSWLMTLTRWRVADKYRVRLADQERREQSPERGANSTTSTIERLPDPASEEAIWDDEWRTHLTETALARLANNVSARNFQIFDLYCRQGWPVRKIARELRVSSAAVYVIAHRLTKKLKAEIEVLRAQLM